MQTQKLHLALLLLCGGLSVYAQDFAALLNSGQLVVRVVTTGAFQDDCLQFQIKNTSRHAIDLNLDAGTQFDSQTQTEQDLIVTATSRHHLAPGHSTSFITKAYCFQADKHCPSKGGRYVLFAKQDTGLRSVAQFLARKHFASSINQNAIWAMSNNHSIAAIPDTSEALQSLRVLLSQLTGQIIPWYRTDYSTYSRPGHNIQRVPIQLVATINFDLPAADFITLMLVDTEGRPAAFILYHWQQAGANISYPLNIPTKTLPKGKYQLVVSTAKQTLFRRELEV